MPAAGTAFSRQQELAERLRQGPAEEARGAAAARPEGPALSWGDFAATHCLARYHPPHKVVRELRESDPQKYARVKQAARYLP